MNDIDVSYFESSSLNKISIPSHVTRIGKNAFSRCQFLETIEFSEKTELKSIDENAFSNSSIRKISFQSHLSKIGDYCFYCCNQLEEVEFPENSELKSIEVFAFYSTLIKSIVIPSSVIELKEDWCMNTPKLNLISIMQNNEYFIDSKNEFIINKMYDKK